MREMKKARVCPVDFCNKFQEFGGEEVDTPEGAKRILKKIQQDPALVELSRDTVRELIFAIVYGNGYEKVRDIWRLVLESEEKETEASMEN